MQRIQKVTESKRDESRDVLKVTRPDDGTTTLVQNWQNSWLFANASLHPDCERFVPYDQYAALEAENEKLRSKPSVNTEKEGDYYIIDTRGTVGNCASLWATGGKGYCCNIEDAGLFRKNYSDRETDVQVPREIVESLIVKHVRIDSIRTEMKKRGLEFKGGRLK